MASGRVAVALNLARCCPEEELLEANSRARCVRHESESILMRFVRLEEFDHQ